MTVFMIFGVMMGCGIKKAGGEGASDTIYAQAPV
jgi:hypothetical protein